jgi:cell division protein FtsQ
MSFGRTLARGPLGALTRRGPLAGSRTRGRRAPGLLRARRALSTRRVRLLVPAAIVVGGLMLGGWLWLRDSSLVAVSRVTVSGASGADAGAIRSALLGAARGMTTLDVNMPQLRTAVASFPVVADLRVSTQFPHGMRIRVIERPPVAVASVGGRNTPVASDGTVLHDMQASPTLPVVPLAVPPGGPRLTGAARDAIELLAAAPPALLARIAEVTTIAGHGLVAQIRSGPSLYFDDATRARAKWMAAIAVLADPGSAGAAYIDVTDPMRPAAGGGTPSASASGSASASAGANGSATTSASGATGTSGG